ncbi:hypothetical protein IR123_10190 [Streptococcus sp. 19428wC2_LYSM12]|uniref:hypothetical protein n=1 Tax=unclassified Streptococcus TaxID=2608887 RepID=UPI001071A450|nr:MULTISPECIES: hypothetical protein [unclassified Streptococcus]MBF0788244.1 hypothetical protein [Streptococcus sp. 19428wC2_LYSM12]TFV04684.1 hypothetical protein E4T79_10160 [Streptococcus sp. LYSM12]
MFPKEFIIEDGHVYYRKKPLYKQPLFWTTIAGAAVAFILDVLFLTFLGIASSPYSYSDTYETYENTESGLLLEKEVGQEVKLQNGLELIVQSMEMDTRIDLDDSYYDQALVVKVQVENPTTKALYFDERSSFLFGSQDSDSDEVESVYTLDNRTYDVPLKKKIDPEEKGEYTFIYGVDKASNYRLMYEGNVWNFQREESL